MAETVLVFGIKKLWDLLIGESERFQGVEEQFDELKSDVNMLRYFLEDAEAKKHTSAMVMNNIKEIEEIVYDAEDMIENFIRKEDTSSIRKRVKRYSCVIVERRKLAFETEAICKRISKVIRNLETLGVQQIIVNKVQMQFIHERQIKMRTTFSNENESDLVGLEENITRLVDYLVEKENSQMVSITGMGGIGKTTLARQVFNHKILKRNFEGLAWACVSQQFRRENVWQTVLRQLRPDYKVSEMKEDELQEKLFHVLETQKPLIVLDDIWREEDWNIIKPMFPHKRGWKVLLTSRDENVALRADPTCFIFKPDFLTLEDSWTLFQRIAFPKEITTKCKNDEEMEEIGRQMIKYCGGLPLALRVLGGLLAAKYTLQDWKRVSKDIGSYLMGKPNFSDDNNWFFNYVLSLSFEELPSYLKQCFLYLAHFPEDYHISVEKLSYYWAAEGILKPNHFDAETIEDNGHSYIEELVRRNMVISKRNFRTLRYETCHLHDMMREVCLYKAKEENFLQIDGIPSSTANSQSRRFVWQNPTILNVEKDTNNPKLRSLMIVVEGQGKSCVLSGLSFKIVQLLRVLDLSNADFKGLKLLDSIGKLIHLRYLSLESAEVCHLPSSLRKLKLLVYLNIDVCYQMMCSIFMPNVLMGMQELRYLELPQYKDENTKLELSNLGNLETLINFSTENCNLEDIQGMTRLRTLTIKLTDEASVETLYASLAELRHLENFSIEYNLKCSYSYESIAERGVFDADCDLHTYDINERIIEKGLFLNMVQLKYLSLDGMYMKRLLSEKHFPPLLTYIRLYNCRLTEDPLPILEKLLHLIKVDMSSSSFYGRRMVSSSGGFPQLQKLSFFGLENWEEWIIEEGSMPHLRTLEISLCKIVQELPHGLSFLYSLKDLNVYQIGEKWKENFSKGGRDYYKVQHISSVTFT